jgi:long-chain acyl-CoA synthetase
VSGTQAPPATTPTIAAQVRDRAQRTPDQVAVRWKRRGIWNEVTWTRYWHDAEAAARMLLALGLEPGGRVVILSENRYEWLLADTATVAAGGVTVGIDAAAAWSIARDVIARTDPAVVIAENQEQLDKVLGIADDLPHAHIVYVDARGIDDRRYTHPRLHHWDVATAAAPQHTHTETVARRIDAAHAGTVVALLPDLGGTAKVRDVALSAADVAAMVDRVGHDVAPAPSAQDLVLPFTSLADRDERLLTAWLNAAAGVQVHFAESLSTVRGDLREAQPTIVFAPAQAWERLLAGVDGRLAGASRFKRWMWRAWRPVAVRVGAARAAGDDLPAALRARAAAGNLLVFRALRARIGMRHVRHAAFTGPLPAEVRHLLVGIGVPLSPLVHDPPEVAAR